MNGKTRALRAFLATLIQEGYDCTVRDRVRERSVVYADDLIVRRKLLPVGPGIVCEKDDKRILIATRDAAAAHTLLAAAVNELEELVI